jgi:anaerobic dimethyl sulfoxide reductase subunit A
MITQKLTEPIFESRSDQWVASQLMERWGVNPKTVYPMDEVEQCSTRLYGATIVKENGVDYEPLISFTAEEASEFGDNVQPRAEGRISYTEFKDKGIVSIPRAKGDNFGYIGGKKFRDDPIANPVGSESGKLEFYSKKAPAITAAMGYSTLPALPEYRPCYTGYEATFSDYEKKVKGEYAFQLYNPHYARSNHAHFDYVEWLREAFVRPVFISSEDADSKGIVDGDTVRIYNDNGSVLRNACVTDRIMPGVVALPHGGQCEVDEKTGFNVGGHDNWLCYSAATGCGVAGYNTQICNFEKYSGEPLPPDIERPNMIPAIQQA